jgi:zinc protease
VKRAVFSILVAAAACGPKTPATAPAPAPDPERPVTGQESTMPLAEQPTQTAGPQDLTFPHEDFRTKQPAAGAPRPLKLPPMKTFALANGLKVYLVEQHTLPLVSLDLNFDGGALLDPPGKEGMSSICMAMLTEGTQQLDKLQYAAALADVASSISTYTDDDSAGLTMSSLAKHLTPTFDLFAATLTSPGFRASDFERLVKRRIESVKQAKGNPVGVAGRAAGPVQFGPSHPFGAVVTEASLAAITLDDCRAFAARLLPGKARLFVVGDLTEAQVRAQFGSAALASWRGAAPATPALPAPKPLAGRIFFVHFPKAAQSQVWALHFGPKRTAPEYLANTLMAAVFGGSFSGRINMNLREDKGYSYGARGGFGYSKQYGTFSVTASVRTDATYQTMLEIDHELRDLAAGKRPVTADELEREKQGMILGLPGAFATAQAALGRYRQLVYYGLPLDYYDSVVAKVGQVSEVQVKSAAARELKPQAAVYLVVGDGDAPVVIRDGARDVPLMKDGVAVTLRAALVELAARGDVGGGGLVELDADGRPVATTKPKP